MGKRNPWLGVILNIFFPGLGYIYAGKVKKGIIAYLALLILGVATLLLGVSHIVLFIFVGLILIYYLYVIIDVYRYIKRNPDAILPKPRKWYSYILIIGLMGVISTTTDFLLDFGPRISFYSIVSPSMNPTLQKGDKVAVQYTQEIKQNDLTVFFPPIRESSFYERDDVVYIFRCIGTPGDSVRVKKGIAEVNQKMVDNVDNLKFSYALSTKNNQSLSEKTLRKYGLNEDSFQAMNGNYIIHATQKNASELKSLDFIESVERISDPFPSSNMYPMGYENSWTSEDYGPVYIPQKGTTIELNNENRKIYGPIILEENPEIEEVGEEYYLSDQLLKEYTFTSDYYFLMGDNRYNAMDSRYHGFISKESIVGKALYLYWGKSSERIGIYF